MAKWNLVAMGQVGLNGWTGKAARPLALAIARRTGRPESQILALANRAGIEGSRVYEVEKSVDTNTVNAYVTGAVRREIAERRAERASGMDIKQFQAAYGPYLTRTFATGRFPALARVVRDGPHLSADETFRAGLEFLLDGIEARISS